ncbi:MAG TPA: glycosyltransferase family 39 protein [Vicinamibacterales bacterium]|nr:glycosyltransferase family 39 protein [Vicinamibacterales bacterium]
MRIRQVQIGLIAVAAAVAAGIAERVLVYRSVVGRLDGDEAVWGLMARHAIHGHISAFFWGQSHEGTQEVVAVAILFAAFGTHVLLMRLVPIALTAITAYVVWRIGRRAIGEPGATVAALLLWVWPAYAIWKLNHWHGSYGSSLLYSALLMLLALRIDEHPMRRDIGLLGLVLGLSFWQSDAIIVVAIPVLVWLTIRRASVWRSSWIALPGLVIGSLPWLLSNVRHDWWTFTVGSGGESYPQRFRAFFTAGLPMLMGLRVPFAVNWLDRWHLAQLAYYALLALFVYVAWRTWRTPFSLVVCVAALYPVVYALSWRTSLVTEPRYVLFIAPALVLLLARAATNWWRGGALLATAGALSAITLHEFVHWQHVNDPNPPDAQAVNVRPAIAALEARNLTHVWADYWVAYRITFLTHEHVIAAEAPLAQLHVVEGGRVMPPVPANYTDSRHPAYDAAVRDSEHQGFLLVRGAPTTAADRRLLLAHGYHETDLANFELFSDF